MIKVIMVDDELPALKLLGSVLKSFDDVQICGIFTDPDELLKNLRKMSMDLIFVDMKMPGMNGLELAGRIQEYNSDIYIVFVTAYDDYAIDAFEADALDYILKPITKDRVQKTLDRYSKRKGEQNNITKAKSTHVECFGRFTIKTGSNEELNFRTSKTEELMAFLIHQDGATISKDKIIDALWYDRDAEKAKAIFYTTIYQLRKELENIGLENVIEQTRKEGGLCKLSWDPDLLDYREYMKNYQKFKSGSYSIEEIKNSIKLFKSGYLFENGYEWAQDRRVELEIINNEMLEGIVDYEVRHKRFELAFPYMQSLAGLYPYNERIQVKFIALYLLMNNIDAAEQYFIKTSNQFKEELDIIFKVDYSQLVKNPYYIFEKSLFE